jgi:hypothetical protein
MSALCQKRARLHFRLFLQEGPAAWIELSCADNLTKREPPCCRPPDKPKAATCTSPIKCLVTATSISFSSRDLSQTSKSTGKSRISQLRKLASFTRVITFDKRGLTSRCRLPKYRRPDTRRSAYRSLAPRAECGPTTSPSRTWDTRADLFSPSLRSLIETWA